MINGIGQNDMFLSYNRINQDRLLNRNNDLDALKQNNASEENNSSKVHEQALASSSKMDLRLDSIAPRENASLEDVSLSLKSNMPYELKGRESNIEDLDIDKAVSDLQKDSALMQYQYFVGDSEMILQNDDGAVMRKVPETLM